MANIKDFIKKIGNSAVSLEEQQQALAQVEQTIIEAKQKRTEAVGKNADMVIQALKTIEAKLEAKLTELNNTPAKQGVQGPTGKAGKDGKNGQDGRDGVSGKDGTDGKDGVDGKDGISVVDAKIDFDGSLVVYLSNGNEIDCGQILSPDVAQNIIINSGGSGTSQTVTDTLVSLQNQINTLTGIDGVLGTMAQQDANAVAITGGTINGTTIGATTPATGKFSTLESTGTGSFGTTSAQYIQVVGNALYPQILAVGSGTNIPLVLQPKGTGALQAQLTDSTATGGNARGANAVDWQTNRTAAAMVASGQYATVGGGSANRATSTFGTASGGNNNNSSGFGAVIAGGNTNISSGAYSFVGAGEGNVASNYPSAVVAGSSNTAAGNFNFIGGGFTNSGTSGSAVTTQSGTMNGTTAVTLSGSNANIRVGQYITGTSIAGDTYVAAISGTSLTLSKNASGSSTSTLSFFTPHGVVVGGGNNQATGSYSFIGGGGDAGTAANRNVASGDWSVVCGGMKHTASGIGSFVGSGGFNSSGVPATGQTASGIGSAVVSGNGNSASGLYAFVGSGITNIASGTVSSISGGGYGTARGIGGYAVFPASNAPIVGTAGVSQSALLVLARETTDATATVLASNASAAGTTNQVILPNNSAYYFKIEVIAGKTAAGDSKAVELKGAIKRGANAASTTLIGSVTSTVIAEDAGASAWTAVATADTTNGGIKLTVTGQASTTIRWVARVTTTEMTF